MPPAKKVKPDPKAKGRTPGVPNYNDRENLAIALAGLEASEMKQTQPSVDLHAEATKVYPNNLDMVVDQYGWPNESTKKGGLYTVEKSKEVRTDIYTHWNDVIKPFCLNTINDKYMEFLVSINASEKGLPSGTSEEECINYIKQRLYEEMTMKSKANKKKCVDLAGDDGAADDDEKGEDDCTEPAQGEDVTMPSSFDGGPFFLTWKHLGPLGSGRGGEHGGAAVFHLSGGTTSPSKANEDGEAGAAEEAGSKGVASKQGQAPSYAAIMQQEAKVETFKAELAARKDRIEELKLLVQYADEDEREEAEKALKKYLQDTPLPKMPAGGN